MVNELDYTVIAEMNLFAEQNELTLDYVIEEFLIDSTFQPIQSTKSWLRKTSVLQFVLTMDRQDIKSLSEQWIQTKQKESPRTLRVLTGQSVVVKSIDKVAQGVWSRPLFYVIILL